MLATVLYQTGLKKKINPLLDALFMEQVDRDRLVYGALRGVAVSGETA
jgi:hypothetical protein